ncbi:Abhydrolase domain-containing protein FAM108C1 [Papilio xuthus]|uniref:palmitoyl-protein hydrolase n=1 Tax=Papilio xuthus TaxID=66420 RepID=A0A194PQM9_PAPXU|nr:Abhydrolase domain-containing protein FAM108C1 [Papilio xuthus]
MNGLSFSELCCLFCCPPCPGKIAAKLAFLPPEPTYAFTPDETGSKFSLTLTERAEWQYSEREKENIEGFYSRTTRGNRIACLFVRCSPNARFTILFSHGNAVDLGQMSSFYLGLGTRINCNIFSYDYSGYGVSGGKPSEKNLYADIDAAWQALRTRYGISPENIILYGQSIGTVPTVDLAARYEVGAVVLHSPLMSGMRVAFPNTKRTWFFDAFPSIDKIPKVTSPVLVIHGTEDEVIDFSHGLAIYERCPRAVEPLWVEGAGHNDVELFNQYLERLKRFLAGAGPSRAGPNKSSANGPASPHTSRDCDKRADPELAAPPPPAPAARSPRLAHNISISVTDTDSPAGVRRRIHLRSLSDVTPASREPAPRARSHSERPRASPLSSRAPSPCPAPSPARSLALSPTPSPAPSPLRPVARSERSSPDATLRVRPVLGDPWRKMSEVDLKSAERRVRGDPWVRSPSTRARRRGRLQRAAAVCEACGRSGCECARCTCSPRAATAGALSPRVPPVLRAHSDDEARPRRLYKSSSQKAICSTTTTTSMAAERAEPPDPLLETTC